MTATGSLAAPAAHTRRARRPGRNENTGLPDPKLVLLLAAGSIFVSSLDLTAEAYLSAYLFCAVAAVVAAAAGVGLLPAGSAAGDTVADVATVGGAAGAGRRGRLAVALVGVAALASLGVFAITADAEETPPPAGVGEAPQSPPGPPAVALPSRSLVLIDVSASMGEQDGVGPTRLQATTEAIAAGVGPAPEAAEMGVWLAGSRFQGERDWAELLPVGPLGERLGPATRRELIQSGLSEVGAVPSDRLGLYDAVLAAFRAMNSTYQPDRGNTVVVFTDGTNDDPAGITLDNLLAALGDEFDPARPVQVNFIGYGNATGDGDTGDGDTSGGGLDSDALARIAGATRGGLYLAASPQETQKLFGTAMPRRA